MRTLLRKIRQRQLHNDKAKARSVLSRNANGYILDVNRVGVYKHPTKKRPSQNSFGLILR